MSEEKMVTLQVQCRMCGMTVLIPVKEKDYQTFISPNRPHIQDIFPYLTPAERELLISHTCQVCWDKMFSTFDE